MKWPIRVVSTCRYTIRDHNREKVGTYRDKPRKTKENTQNYGKLTKLCNDIEKCPNKLKTDNKLKKTMERVSERVVSPLPKRG